MPGLEPRALSAGLQAQPPAWGPHQAIWNRWQQPLGCSHLLPGEQLQPAWNPLSCPGSVAGQER